MENKKYYLYDCHTGGRYITTEEIDEEELYCEACGDSDYLIEVYDTEEEALAEVEK